MRLYALAGVVLATGCIDADDIARTLLNPPVEAIQQYPVTPGTQGLQYDDFTVTTDDAISIKGWFIPHPQAGKRVVVLCHGLAGNRAEALDVGTALRSRLPVHLVLFDLRRHGQSDMADFTYGFHERKDIAAVLTHVQERLAAPPEVVVVGWSAGAVVALGFAAEAAGVQGVVAINAFSSLRDITLSRKPFFVSAATAEAGLQLAGERGGFTPEDVSAEQIAGRLKVPLLVVVGLDDEVVPPEHSLAIHRAAPRAQLLKLPETGHMDWAVQPAFTAALRTFVRASLAITS